jgi:hypothetical protein
VIPGFPRPPRKRGCLPALGLGQREGPARPRPGLVDLRRRQSGPARGGRVPLAPNTPTQIAQPTATPTPTPTQTATPTRIHGLASVPPSRTPYPHSAASRRHRMRNSRAGGHPGPYQRQRPCRLRPTPSVVSATVPDPLRRAERLGHPIPHDRGPRGDDKCRWKHPAGAPRGGLRHAAMGCDSLAATPFPRSPRYSGCTIVLKRARRRKDA